VSTSLPAITFHDPQDQVDLGQLLQILRRRARLIALFVGGCTLIALLHVLFATPQFTVRGALYLGDAQGSGGGPAQDAGSGLSFLSDYSTQSDVETQIELITAGALVQHAVLETGLNAQITPSGAPPLTYWRWRLLYGGKTSSFAPGSDKLQALFATTPGRYRIVIGQDLNYNLYSQSDFFSHGRLLLSGVLGQPAAGHGINLLIQPAGSDFVPVPGKSYDLKVTSPDALADSLLAGALDVTAGGSAQQPTKIAFLEFRWTNPYQAQLFVNQMMTDYIATQLSWKTESASTTESFVTQQLAKVSAALTEADKNLAEYQSQTGIVDVPENSQTVINQLSQYQTQRNTLELQRETLQQLDTEFSKRQGSFDPYLVSQSNDTVLSGLTNTLSEAEVKLAQLRGQFTDNSPDVKLQQAQVAELEGSIRTMVRNDLTSANDSLANLDKIIAKLQEQIKAMPAESLKVVSLQRSTDVLGQLYVSLMEKEEQAQVSKAATIINTRIVTPADMPLGPTSPKAVITVIFGALVGLVAGIAVVFGQRAFSGRFESEDEIRVAVRLPIYGAVPRHPKLEFSGGIFGPKILNPFSESFRLLRGNIYRSTVAGKAMVILIVSSSKQDGKTTVTANLAKILADDGKRVVLVDGDLHLSRLQGLLKTDTTPGLTDWLATNIRPPMENWPEERFKVLPSGTASFSGREQLNETALETVFASLKEDFDYIIVDSPPLPTVSDGMIFGVFADLILSVISVSHTSRRTLNIHNELIESLDRPHGIIINEVDAPNHGNSDAYFLGDAVRRGKFTGFFKPK
jgi:tyrosine-protein kinase Etk/Wzc